MFCCLKRKAKVAAASPSANTSTTPSPSPDPDANARLAPAYALGYRSGPLYLPHPPGMTYDIVHTAQQAHDGEDGWLSQSAAADSAANVAGVTSWLVFALAHAHQGPYRTGPLDQGWRGAWKSSFQRAFVRTVAQALPLPEGLPDAAKVDDPGVGGSGQNHGDRPSIHDKLVGVTNRLMALEAARLEAHHRKLCSDGHGETVVDLAAIELKVKELRADDSDTPLHQGLHLALLSKDPLIRVVVDRVVARASAPMVPNYYLAARKRDMLVLLARSFDQPFATAVSGAVGYVTDIEPIAATRMRANWEAAHKAAEAEHELQPGSLSGNFDTIFDHLSRLVTSSSATRPIHSCMSPIHPCMSPRAM